jgi:lipopolysaccharide biosynthesis glycosyltransferase
MLLIIPTDGNYLEPAFVTMNSLASYAPRGTKICLLFLRNSPLEDALFEAIILEAQEHFQEEYGEKIVFSSLAVQSNYFYDFSKFHLTSATLQKLVIPSIFPTEDICLSIDAGMIFGHSTAEFLAHVAKPSEAAVMAFTTASDASLQASQLQIEHHPLYPAGGILAFRPEIYLRQDLLKRCMNTFQNLRNEIIYGEQDIICFTLKNSELAGFSFVETRIHIDLANDQSWVNADDFVQTYLSHQYLYMKHVGVFKPWRLWVLSPAKSIYIHAVSQLPEAVKLLTKHPILACQHSSTDKFSTIFSERQFQLFEEHLGLAIDRRVYKS